MYGWKHNLTLVRKTDDAAIFRGAAAGAGNVSLDTISTFMPHVMPADAEKFSIYKTIESKAKVPVAYRTRQCDMLSVPESITFTRRLRVKTAPEKPRFIIVSFQTAKDGDQTKNQSMFDISMHEITLNRYNSAHRTYPSDLPSPLPLNPIIPPPLSLSTR